MLIGLLIAYILLGGSHQTFLLNPNLEKDVSQYVKDKSRKEEIDKIIKQTIKSEEIFQKKIEKPACKKLEDLNMNHLSTQSQFNKEYASIYDSLKDLQNSYLSSELKIRSLIHANEWDSIMNKTLAQPSREKVSKAIYAKNIKLRDQLIKACNERITDSVNRKKANSYVDTYFTKGNSLAKAFLDLNYKYLSAIRPYTAPRSDFENTGKEMIDLRKNYTDYLVDMRFKLMAITPEREWPGLAKELNGEFNYLGAGGTR
jgi:hypothetical protein